VRRGWGISRFYQNFKEKIYAGGNNFVPWDRVYKVGVIKRKGGDGPCRHRLPALKCLTRNPDFTYYS
jgi:hypothetical protein